MITKNVRFLLKFILRSLLVLLKEQIMIKSLTRILVILLIISNISYAQNTGNKIVIGTIDTIYSNILKEKRNVWVYVPNGDGQNQRYPVLYLLDAEDHFHSAVGIVKQLSGVLPDMIIVGITNTIRNRDLTPTHVEPNRNVDEGYARVSGGGENFMRFIEKELFPHIDSLYPSSSYRIFSGHSLGGLTVVNAFINHTNLFNAYIALDPSLWWDKQQLVAQAKKVLTTRNFENKSLFIAIANNMPAGMDTIAVQKDTTDNTMLTRVVFKLVGALKETEHRGLRWNYKFYPTERHGTVELMAEYDALHFLFDYYRFSTRIFEANPNMNIDSFVNAHFKTISKNFGYTVLPSEGLINNLAYTCLGIHRNDKAYSFFNMNIENHPSSSNAFDSMGDFYAATGDINKAIENYTQSLRLLETADTRRKLDELKVKK
jgi:predicted alpha/beta superfamily hydrolase